VLIVMKVDATDAQVREVEERIRSLGFRANPIPGSERTAIGITGNAGPIDPAEFEGLPGVKEAIRVTRPYKLVSREVKPADSVIDVGGRPIGGRHIAVIAGPCAIESETQTRTIAAAVAEAGADFFRGGAFKPRTSPYAFQGLGLEGLKILARMRQETGLPVVTEAVDEESMAMVEDYADAAQIGARNMQNFSLLKRAGRARMPIFLKRGLSATLEELLMAAEYIVSEGNYRVFLCERLPQHEEEEEEAVYPVVARLMGGEDPMSSMARAHVEISHLVRVYRQLLEELPPEGPDRDDLTDLRRVLYGLHAILRLHFAQEEEAYAWLSAEESVSV